MAPFTEGEKTIGASIKYVVATPNNYGLPEYESGALTIDLQNYNGGELSLTLSDPDFEYDLIDRNEDFTCVKRGRNLVFRLHEDVSNANTYTLYLRIRESYTEVNVKVVM